MANQYHILYFTLVQKTHSTEDLSNSLFFQSHSAKIRSIYSTSSLYIISDKDLSYSHLFQFHDAKIRSTRFTSSSYIISNKNLSHIHLFCPTFTTSQVNQQLKSAQFIGHPSHLINRTATKTYLTIIKADGVRVLLLILVWV